MFSFFGLKARLEEPVEMCQSAMSQALEFLITNLIEQNLDHGSRELQEGSDQDQTS